MTRQLVISALEKAIRKGLIKTGAIIQTGEANMHRMDFADFYNRADFANQCRVKAIVMIMLKPRASFQGLMQNWWRAEFLKTSNKPARKSSFTSKATIIEQDYIQVWGYKSPIESEMELKSKMEETKDSFCLK